MMKLKNISLLIVKYQLFILDDVDLAKQFSKLNLNRIKIASLFVVLLSAYHLIVLLFTYQPHVVDSSLATWKWGIVSAHAALFVIFTAIAGFLFYEKTFRYFQSSSKQIVEMVVYLSILFISNGIALFDQLITPSITPILLGAVAVSLVVLIPPVQAFAILTINLYLFIYFSPLFQSNSAILVSNNLNVFTMMVISLFITATLWIETVKRIRQEQILHQQHLALEANTHEAALKTSALEEANRQNKKLFSIIAHDLRGPFNTLIASSELLLDDEILLDEKEALTLKTNLLKTSQSTFLLLENLLGWSQMQQNNMMPQPKLMFPAQVLRSAILDCKHIAEAKKISLEARILEEAQCVADQFMLQTIFRNLLMNAIKFSHKDSVIVIEMTKNSQDKILSFHFIDQGIGMTDEVKASLFQTMSSKNQGTLGETGIGLGLLLCKEFSDTMHGTLTITSSLWKGSTFTFTIPLAEA